MTQEANPRTTVESKKRALFWMLFPVALLVTSVSGWLVMVSIAVDDPGFAVEADYYKKAANYDAVIEQRAENSRLGYQVELESFAASSSQEARLVLHVRDRLGVPLAGARIEVMALPVARAFDVQELSLRESEDGTFTATLARPRVGLWELRVTVHHAGKTFTEVLRPELASARSEARRRGGAVPS